MFLGALVYAVLLGLATAGSPIQTGSSPSTLQNASVPTLPFPPAQVPSPH